MVLQQGASAHRLASGGLLMQQHAAAVQGAPLRRCILTTGVPARRTPCGVVKVRPCDVVLQRKALMQSGVMVIVRCRLASDDPPTPQHENAAEVLGAIARARACPLTRGLVHPSAVTLLARHAFALGPRPRRVQVPKRPSLHTRI